MLKCLCHLTTVARKRKLARWDIERCVFHDCTVLVYGAPGSTRRVGFDHLFTVSEELTNLLVITVYVKPW